MTNRANTDSISLDGSASGRSAIGDDVLTLRPSARPCHMETFGIVPPVGGLGRRLSV